MTESRTSRPAVISCAWISRTAASLTHARLSILSPRDPQPNVYDDTGWTFGELGNIQVVRVTDRKALTRRWTRRGEVRSAGGVRARIDLRLVNATRQQSDYVRYRLRRASFDAAEEPFEAVGKKFNRGSFIIRNASADEVNKATSELGLQAFAIATAPTVKSHPVKAARVAIMHTWLSTQDEGWWRLAFDQMGVPFDYISTQDVAKDNDLNKKYDVIIFGPAAATSTQSFKAGRCTGIRSRGKPLH